MADTKPGSDLPRMVPDRDEIRTRKGGAGASSTRTPPVQPGSGRPSAPAKKTGGTLVWVVMVVLLAAIVGLGLMAYSQRQLLASYEERLQLADNRIVSLEQAMNETDESVAMNETAINAQFRSIKSETELQMTEIRKLWDVANKRNKNWIEENQQAIGQLQADTQKQDERLNVLQTSLNQQTDRVASLSKSTAEREAAIESLRSELNSSREQLASIKQSVEAFNTSELEERVISLALNQETLREEQGRISNAQQQVSDRVGSMEEIIESIDAGRLETNRRLVALREQLQTLETRVSALGN